LVSRSKNIQLRYFNLSGNKRLEIKPAERVHENSMVNNVKSDYLANFSTLGHLRILGLMDITLRIPLPDESDDRRVRTSYSDVNNMAYGISDTLGKYEHLLLADMVVPSFRGKDTECLFGIFGAAYTMTPSVISRVPRFLAEYFSSIFADELAKLRPGETVPDALRRSFLLLNKSCYDSLTSYESGGRKGSQASTGTSNGFGNAGSVTPQNAALLRTGGSGIVAYIADRTLYVANAGLALAVVSRKGTAELLSYKHEPFERSEAGRIRAAEGWISPKGLLNEDLDMSRGFGFYHLLPSLTARPDVRTYELSESDEFIIIANKGVWDFMSYQTAVDIACREKDDPMMAAQKLRDFALSYGADNSIMVMIVAVGDLFSPRTGPTRGGARQAVVDESFGSDGYYRKRQRGKDEIGDRTLARLDREIPPPTGMVALVFTDIKNSTALWETNVGMQTAIRMHNSLLRRQLRIIGGYEVKTEGDAFMVSFPTVASALLWCFSCQLMLITEEGPKEIVDCEDGREIFNEKGELIYRGIWVRMGIHWGAPACEADPITKRMDYFGPIVNRAARISGSADGGQIMVSEDVVQEIQSVYDSLEAQAEQAAKVGEDEAQSDEIARVEAEEKLGPHIAQLRKLGFGISYVGEKKLKGTSHLFPLCCNLKPDFPPRLTIRFLPSDRSRTSREALPRLPHRPCEPTRLRRPKGDRHQCPDLRTQSWSRQRRRGSPARLHLHPARGPLLVRPIAIRHGRLAVDDDAEGRDRESGVEIHFEKPGPAAAPPHDRDDR
jgi:adenylate cyclase